MAVPDWTSDADYQVIDRLDVAGLAWEFARRNPGLREAATRPKPDLSPWGLAIPADPALTAEETEVWWRWDFAPGVVVRFVKVEGDGGATAGALRAAAVASRGAHLRFPNGLRAILPDGLADSEVIAVVAPLDGWLSVRAAAARALQQGLAGRWRALPLPPRLRRIRLRQMLRALDARARTASWREIALRVLGARFHGSAAWRDAAERGVAIRLAAAGLALVRGGYAALLRKRALPKG